MIEKKWCLIIVLFLFCAVVPVVSAENHPVIQWQNSFGSSGQDDAYRKEQAADNGNTNSAVIAQMSALPVSFIENEGQFDPHVRFAIKGSASMLFFTPGEVVIASSEGSVVRQGFIGAAADPRIEGTDRLYGVANFFTGNEPSQWHTGVPTFGEIVYRNLYPGVDLRYKGIEGRLKREFIVAPGADPSVIKLHYDGADSVIMDDSGAIRIIVGNSTLIESPPVCYQEFDGIQKPVPAHYNIISDRDVIFSIGSYDPNFPLVIDPMLEYSTYLGGSSNDYGNSIAVDGSGNAYVTGETWSANFPITSGAYQGTSNGVKEAFVAKLNPTGTGLIYSTYLGGSGSDSSGWGIAVDNGGNALVTGWTGSSHFPVTTGAFQMSIHGCNDAFVTKLNPTGSSLMYSTYLGGTSGDIGTGIAVDSSGNAYVTGSTLSPDFPVTTGAYQITKAGGSSDAFVTKLNPTAGSGLMYSTYLGGSGDEQGRGIAFDSDGNTYVAGYTTSTNFPITGGAYQIANAGENDVFVTKLNPTAGSGLTYSTYLGGSGQDQGFSIAIDDSRNVYVTGYTFSGNFPKTTGAYQIVNAGNTDIFVTKLNPTAGSGLEYSTYLGGSSNDCGNSIAVDGSGNAFVTGYTSSGNFPTTTGAYQTVMAGSNDVFVTKMNPTGTGLVYSTYLGGNGDDQGRGIVTDDSGSVYVTGFTDSSKFPTTTSAFQIVSGGMIDAFVTKLNVNVPVTTVPVTTTETIITTVTETVVTTVTTPTITPTTNVTPCGCCCCCGPCSDTRTGAGGSVARSADVPLFIWLGIWTVLIGAVVGGVLYYIVKKTR